MTKTLFIVLIVTVVVLLYWALFYFIEKRNWPIRVKFSLVGLALCLPLIIAIPFSRGDQMGVGIVIFGVIGVVIIGYIIGSVVDVFNKKKLNNSESQVPPATKNSHFVKYALMVIFGYMVISSLVRYIAQLF